MNTLICKEPNQNLKIGKIIEVDGKTVLVISIDSNEFYSDDGFVEKQVLKALLVMVS